MAAQGRATQRRLQSLEEQQRRRDEVVLHPQAKGSLPGGRKAPEDHSLEKVLLELEKEKLRCENLATVNSRLREQLNKENEVNSALQGDVGKLMADQMKAQKELELKESEWHREHEALREKLYAKDNTINMLQDRCREQEEECERLQQRLEQLEEECRSSRQQQLLQALAEALRSDCAKLRKVKEELQQNLRKNQEAWHLPQHKIELQLKEKVEQQQALERAHRDHGLLLKDFAALEEKHSLLQRELLTVQEALEKALLQRNQLMQDKNELIVALKKVVLGGSESRVSIASTASTKRPDSSFTLSSMSSTEAESAFEVCKEQPAKRQEVAQVSHQQDSARLDREQLLQECSGQAHALAEMSREKESLVHKVAALEGQLAALEQDRQGLSEQLTQARSVNKTLEYSQSEAQQHTLQLESTRSQLEVQLQTARQANEVIEGEVKCLRWKLEAERSLMQEERKNMAEQLLQAQQQNNKTPQLRETDHKVEGNKLLQVLQATAGLQQSWLSEKKLLLQRLGSLQQEVARLKLANAEMKEFNGELKKTLEEVECQRRKLMRLHRDQSLPAASGSSFSKSYQHKMPASRGVRTEVSLVTHPRGSSPPV